MPKHVPDPEEPAGQSTTRESSRPTEETDSSRVEVEIPRFPKPVTWVEELGLSMQQTGGNWLLADHACDRPFDPAGYDEESTALDASMQIECGAVGSEGRWESETESASSWGSPGELRAEASASASVPETSGARSVTEFDFGPRHARADPPTAFVISPSMAADTNPGGAFEHFDLRMHEDARWGGIAPASPDADDAFSTQKTQNRGVSQIWGGFGEGTAATPVAITARMRIPEVAGYEILGELGRGGMGIVFKARQLRLNRLAALKMILAGEYAGPDAVERFMAEAEIVARLRHPNIVQIYAIGDCDGRPYVELEYVDGGSLAGRLEGTPWPPRAAARVIESLAHGMTEAHRLGIVHRDLKPANILMTEEGVPKISDFGLAKMLERETGLTRTESILGSPSYMAPEQAEGKAKEVGPSADIYALGAILYELLTGRPPFVAPTVLATLDLVKNAEPVPPARLQPGLPRDLETICLKCLQKEAGGRYESADDLADDLASFLNDEPIKARPTTAVERLWKLVRRRPLPAAMVCVSAASLAVAALGWASYSADRNHQRQVERARFARVERQAGQLLVLGNEALRRGDLEGAKAQYSSALALTRNEPALAALRGQVGRFLDVSDRRINDQKNRAAARSRLAAFHRYYDEAVFYQSQYTGLEPEANNRAGRAAARNALKQFESEAGSSEVDPVRLGQFDAVERETLDSGRFELMLLLAEMVSQPIGDEKPEAQAREALKILDGATRFRPANAAFHRRRGALFERLGDRATALEETARATQLAQTETRTPGDDFMEGEDAYRHRDLKRAVEAFYRVLMRQPDHFWAQYLLAVCHLKEHRPSEAQAALTACQSRRPGFVWTYVLKGFAEGEMRQFDLAEADFQKAEELGFNGPERYVMLVNRGVMRIRAGRHADAVVDLRAAVALKPDQFQAYVNLAQAYQNMKSYDAALATLDEAVARSPDQAVLYRARSQVQRLRSHDAEALRDLEKAIALSSPTDPSLVNDHLERGLILHQAGRLKEALQACDQALDLQDDRPDVHRLRGVILVGLKRFDEAIRSFDVCLNQGAPSSPLYEARGLALSSGGAYDRAITDFTLALKMGRSTSSLHANRGWAYLFSGASALAIRDFDEALRLDPVNGHALSGRALARIQVRKVREAVADAEAAARAGASDARLLYNAARVHCQAALLIEADPAGKSGSWDQAGRCRSEAVSLLRRCLDLMPEGDRRTFWRQVVEEDAAFEPIRRSSKFRALAARVARRESDALPSRGGTR